MCGPATTIWTKPGDILFVLKAPDLVERGDVVVIDSGARLDAAVIGDIVGGVMARAGAEGLIVDGAVRDVDGLRELGIPTFARGVQDRKSVVSGKRVDLGGRRIIKKQDTE